MQLYSVEQKRSQALEAHAAAFSTIKASCPCMREHRNLWIPAQKARSTFRGVRPTVCCMFSYPL